LDISSSFFLQTAIDLESGWFPMCQSPVPQESTKKVSLGSLDANRPSAMGDRQMFPKQTIKILTGIL
jgi:hypothetical protein